tara:strand:- start:593 stop:742 length:150 start_codon:yes stop_codon:yes gene_type:complete
MNAVEFIFALGAVFGSTAFWFAWLTLVYKFENNSNKDVSQLENKEETII